MKPTSDPYRVLGIARAATIEQVKAAHRSLAKQYHPDGGTGDEPRFLAVQEAYQLLSDPLRRREWDRQHTSAPMRAGSPARPGSTPRPSTTQNGAPRGPGDGTGPPAWAARDPGARRARRRSGGRRTWSAERVPWWEDFRPGRGDRADADATSRDPDARSGRADPGDLDSSSTMDFDVFDRSSGAAWSMAARKHFRKGDADLPSRGAWRYRGTQVVTGAEARKVASEEEAEAAARASRARRSTSTDPAGG